ncbi:hypothetical protein CMI47_01140 [Candidatus Pacearchaeota archaeon]|nr:hypothetical protein [Candidatus Pacearchaeota archaeon]
MLGVPGVPAGTEGFVATLVATTSLGDTRGLHGGVFPQAHPAAPGGAPTLLLGAVVADVRLPAQRSSQVRGRAHGPAVLAELHGYHPVGCGILFLWRVAPFTAPGSVARCVYGAAPRTAAPWLGAALTQARLVFNRMASHLDSLCSAWFCSFGFEVENGFRAFAARHPANLAHWPQVCVG